MIRLGSYTFSDTDARRTLTHFDAIWEQFAVGRDATALTTIRPVDDPAAPLEDRLAVVWSALLAAGPALRAAGQLPARHEGSVVGLHVSDGGVPKQAIDSAEVGWTGVVGDRQRSRQHHGRPWQALCIWSAEVIDAFAEAGHPIAPGSAGENVTVGGIPWELVRPGVRLRLGEVACEVTAFTEPCTHNARWFLGGDFRLMGADRGPVSRIYATVLTPGRIANGDAAILEP